MVVGSLVIRVVGSGIKVEGLELRLLCWSLGLRILCVEYIKGFGAQG